MDASRRRMRGRWGSRRSAPFAFRRARAGMIFKLAVAAPTPRSWRAISSAAVGLYAIGAFWIYALTTAGAIFASTSLIISATSGEIFSGVRSPAADLPERISGWTALLVAFRVGVYVSADA